MRIDWKKAAIGLAIGITQILMSSPITARADGVGAGPGDPFVLVRHEESQQSQDSQRESPGTGVFINGRALTPEKLRALQTLYGPVPPGRYWYDSFSGLFGVWGREAAGFLHPGLDLGEVPAMASHGNTGVFINGRELNMLEWLYFQQIFGAVPQGRWWLDGKTGNVGLVGNPRPLANLGLAIQQAQQRQQGGQYGGGTQGGGTSYRWSNQTGFGGVQGRCVYINVPGSGSVMSSGCD